MQTTLQHHSTSRTSLSDPSRRFLPSAEGKKVSCPDRYGQYWRLSCILWCNDTLRIRPHTEREKGALLNLHDILESGVNRIDTEGTLEEMGKPSMDDRLSNDVKGGASVTTDLTDDNLSARSD